MALSRMASWYTHAHVYSEYYAQCTCMYVCVHTTNASCAYQAISPLTHIYNNFFFTYMYLRLFLYFLTMTFFNLYSSPPSLSLLPSSQALAMATADLHGATVILANDPDTDRLALAEKNPSTGQWDIFSGNEIGALMGWWLFRNFKETHPNFQSRHFCFYIL